MQLQSFFSFALNAGISSLGIFALVALLACLLAIEVACICILIAKMRHAKNTDEAVEDQTYFDHGGIVFALGAIPTVAYTSLLWLSVACVLAAVVLVILLFAAHAKGYRFAASGRVQEQESTEEVPTEGEITFEDAEFPSDEPTDTEEPFEEELYSEELDGDAADEAMFHELFAASEEELLEESDADADDTQAEAEVEEQPMPVPVQEVLPEDGVAASDEAQPYRVVEKVVTETYKEVIKEVPAEQTSAAADALLEKLSDFLDYEMQKKKDADAAAAQEGSAILPAMADADQDEDDDENDDAEDGIDGEEADEDETLDEGDGEGERFTGNERIIGFDEATGCYIVAHYRKSFEAKLIQAKPHIKQYYSELRNALLSYKGSKNRISWSADSFHNGRQPIAKINVKTRILEIYLALDPASLEGTVYRGKDVSSKKKYADTPFQYKVRTPRKFKWAMELVQRTCEEHGLSPIDIEKVDYEAEYAFDTTENLVARGLIKEYIRQEKPATSFELDPDHTPDVPEEDGSVIPANANFLWEFDNERMEESPGEPAEEEETVEEEALECSATDAEKSTEEADAPTVRETVKVTEMRYTERYYTNAEPTFEQVITTTDPLALSDASEDAEDEAPESDVLYADEPLTEPEREEEAEDEEFFFSDADPDDEEALSDVEAIFGEEESDGEELTDGEEDEDVFEEIPEEIPEDVSEEEFDTEEIEYEEIEEEEEPVVEVPTSNTSVALVDLCSVQAYYAEGETVSLGTLKDKGLILPSATTLKVYASASLSKRLNVEANHFTMDAIIAISSVDGESAMIR